MKTHTKNAQEKKGGVGDGPTMGPHGLLASVHGNAPAAPTEFPKPHRVPALARCILVVLVAGPFALMSVLLSIAARLLQVPSAVVYIAAYGAGRVTQWLTARVMGTSLPPPH